MPLAGEEPVRVDLARRDVVAGVGEVVQLQPVAVGHGRRHRVEDGGVDLGHVDVDGLDGGVARHGRLELGERGVDDGQLRPGGRGPQRAQRGDERDALVGRETQRPAEELGVADVDDVVALERVEVDVDELAGVLPHAREHEQPQVVADLLRADPELVRDLLDRHAVVALQVRHEGEHPHDLLGGAVGRPAHAGTSSWSSSAARSRATTWSRRSGGSSTTTSGP